MWSAIVSFLGHTHLLFMCPHRLVYINSCIRFLIYYSQNTRVTLKGFSPKIKFKPVHEISNNVVCVTSKASDQPAHMRSLIRAFASCLNIL